MNKLPVILLAFANNKLQQAGHLDQLAREEDAIRSALQKAEEDQLCKVVTFGNASLQNIVDAFRRYRDQIAIFHFAGHADDFSIHLERRHPEVDKISKEGFAGFLGQQKGLKLVFLNGCATIAHAQSLHEQMVPAVIATTRPVNDAEAANLAIRFYQSLGRGNSLDRSFNEAIQLLKTGESTIQIQARGLGDKKTVHSRGWEFLKASGQYNIASWSFPEAVGNPLYHLPIPKEATPPFPFPGLRSYTKSEANIFWGRDKEIRDFYVHVTQNKKSNITLFYGAAGVGKSSLIEAGLLPRLSGEIQVCQLTGIDDLGSWEVKLQKWLQSSNPEKEKLLILDQVSEPSDFLLSTIQEQLKVNDKTLQIILIINTVNRPQWEASLSNYQIFYLAPISFKGIQSIVKNLANTYQIKVEEHFADRLANGILQDSESPIAPILQYSLHQLWEKAIKKKRDKPYLEGPLYQELIQEGLWQNFIQQQLQTLNTEAYASGFYFQLLQDCLLTNPSNRDKWAEAYTLKKSVFHKHLQSLQAARLLSAPATDKTDDLQQFRLIHHQLRTPLWDVISQSNLPVQAIRRFLITTLQQKNNSLSRVQIQLIQDHRHYLPKLSEQENLLLSDSKRKIKNHSVKKTILSIFQVLVCLFILFYGFQIANPYLLLFSILAIVLYKN